MHLLLVTFGTHPIPHVSWSAQKTSLHILSDTLVYFDLYELAQNISSFFGVRLYPFEL